jgi:Rap1a immunity proteins
MTVGLATMMNNNGLAWRCAHIPEEATLEQIIQAVVRYIGARPNRLHEPFRLLALEALADAWPCRDAKVTPPSRR